MRKYAVFLLTAMMALSPRTGQALHFGPLPNPAPTVSMALYEAMEFVGYLPQDAYVGMYSDGTTTLHVNLTKDSDLWNTLPAFEAIVLHEVKYTLGDLRVAAELVNEHAKAFPLTSIEVNIVKNNVTVGVALASDEIRAAIQALVPSPDLVDILLSRIPYVDASREEPVADIEAAREYLSEQGLTEPDDFIWDAETKTLHASLSLGSTARNKLAGIEGVILHDVLFPEEALEALRDLYRTYRDVEGMLWIRDAYVDPQANCVVVLTGLREERLLQWLFAQAPNPEMVWIKWGDTEAPMGNVPPWPLSS